MSSFIEVKRERAKKTIPRFTISKHGIHMNYIAYSLLGRPKAIKLKVDSQNKLIKLINDKDGLRVRPYKHEVRIHKKDLMAKLGLSSILTRPAVIILNEPNSVILKVMDIN